MRGDAALRFDLGKRENRITGTPKLEGPDFLEIFALAEDLGPDRVI
jgi:hypothetical protein